MAKPTTTADITISLTVPLQKEAYEFFEQAAQTKGRDPIQMIASAVRYWCDQQSRGGLFLESEETRYLQRIAEKPFGSGKDIVKLVEEKLNREEGQYMIKYPIDPAWYEPLKTAAQEMGWTPEELLGDVVSTCLGNSWAYSWTPENVARFSPQADRRVKEILGKNLYFGEDILQALEELAKFRKSAAKAA